MSFPGYDNIVVGTVTYGDRYSLLKQSILSIIESGIKNIVIIDNGCNYSVKDRIVNDFSEFSCSISVEKILLNTGSAEGFNKVIKYASESIRCCEYIYLLDDDNVINHNTINSIISLYQKYDTMTCFLSLRKDRKEFVLAHKNGYWNNAEKNSFQSFHIKKIFKKLINRFSNFNKKSMVNIAYAPYGGFFFNKFWVEKIGLPNLDFGLYGDDHEYTYRITKSGGYIYLCADSEVVDIEKSWYLQDTKVHRFFIRDVNVKRLYMSIRNRVKFEKYNLIDNQFIYIINAILYILSAFIVSSFSNYHAYKNVDLIIRAIKDGYQDEK